MIHTVRWDAAAHKSSSLTLADLPSSATALAPGDVIWIDLENPTAEEESLIFRTFLPVHPLTVEDATKPRRTPEEGAHLPKVEEFPDYLFVIVNPLPPEVCSIKPPVKVRLGKLVRPQLSAILTHHVLITHHYATEASVTAVREYVGRHHDCTGRGPDFLFHLILDAMVDDYAPIVEGIADKLDKLETRLFRHPTPDVLMKLLRLKRRVSFLRKTLVLEREVLARLTRGEFHLIDPREAVYYRNVYDHLVRYTELTESAREMVSDLMQTHLSAVSNKLNEVMKVLTMISTIVLPMTLVAGIYGMNFTNIPEIQEPWGYPMALGMMVLLAAISLGVFRWKRWL